MPRPPCYSLPAASYLQLQLGLWLRTQMGLPFQLRSASCGQLWGPGVVVPGLWLLTWLGVGAGAQVWLVGLFFFSFSVAAKPLEFL